MKNELSIKAILIGMAAIYGISILTGVVSALLIPVSRALSAEEVKHDLLSILFVGGIIARFSGGFVTGWIAKHDQVKNAFALVILDLVLNETLAVFKGSDPVLSLLEGMVKTLLAVLGGGYLAKLAFGGRVNL